ncbi:MAG TPA: OmpA family protein [Myxococcales bacterium]|nr:OmpA family protein [Myxococcales bacterium]
MRIAPWFAFAAISLASSSAFGQALPQPAPNNDWSGFSGSPPPATQPAPATPPPAQPPAATPSDQGLPPAAPAPTYPPAQPPPPAYVPPPAAPSAPQAAPMAPPAGAPGDNGNVVKESTVSEPSATPATVDMSFGDKGTERLTSDVLGPIGLYHTEAADIGPVGIVRLGLAGQYFRDNDFPVIGADDERSVGILTLGWTPLKFLDVYGGTQVSSNVSSGAHGTSPAFVGELGDFWLGVKAGGFVAGGLAIGGDLRAYGYSAVGSSSPGAGAFEPTLLVTYDFLQNSRFPLRLHLNFGGFIGSLGNLTTTNTEGEAVSLRAPEQFALGYTPYDQLRTRFGIEVPFPDITGFVEYELLTPLGTGNLVGPDQNPVSYGQALPNDLDFGVRVSALQDVSFLAAVDVAFQERVALGVPILPPWEAYLAVSYNWDPVVRSSVKTVETVKTVTQPVVQEEKPAQVVGTVVDAATGKPIAGAIISINGSGLPPVATSATEGRFQSYDLHEGPVDLTVTRDGYEAGTAHAVVKKGEVAQVQVSLKASAQPVSLSLHVHSKKGKPLAASVTVEGPAGFKQDVSVPDSGEAQLSLPTPGAYALRTSADGFLGKADRVDAVTGQPASADIELSPKPRRSVLIITANKIRLKKQVHFATNKSEVLPDSFGILDQVVDAIIKNHVDKIRVEGHTDNQGSKEHNLALSQQRADAVMQWLIKAGIPADKLESVGYGDTKPVAPNLTNRGRALNRRVEFDIL